MTDQSGFDLKPTIDWYKKNKDILLARLPTQGHSNIFPVTRNAEPDISEAEIAGLIGLFPQQARDRSILQDIIIMPSTWFHRDSTSDKPIPTQDVREAINTTSIAPSYIDYKDWLGKIVLFKLPRRQVRDSDIRKIIASEGLVHEVAHSIAVEPMYRNEYSMIFPGNSVVQGEDFVKNFVDSTEPLPPISHYSSLFRYKNGKFKGKCPSTIYRSISEELAESITAYLLGFAYSGDNERSLDPFKDRPEVKRLMHDFLHARRKK